MLPPNVDSPTSPDFTKNPPPPYTPISPWLSTSTRTADVHAARSMGVRPDRAAMNILTCTIIPLISDTSAPPLNTSGGKSVI
jgi:hypothetical protein